MLRTLLFALTTIFVAVSAHAEVVGTAVLNGRVVHLNADQTWQYADGDVGVGKQCSTFHSAFKFCAPPTEWGVTSKLSPDAAISYRRSDREYLMFIVEEIGTNDGFSLDFLTTAAIENAATGTGLIKEQVPVFYAQDRDLFGTPARTIAYGLNFDGLDVVYLNTAYVQSDLSFQMITLFISKEVTEAHKQLHEQALAYIEKTGQ